MSLVLIGVAAWLVLALFVCSLGRAAKSADRRELAGLAVADTFLSSGQHGAAGQHATAMSAEPLA